MRVLLLILAFNSSACTIQKIYTDGKVVKDSLKVKVAGFEIKKAN
jgi:hypothetical protein